jgi:hypothetical protein
MFSVVAGKKPPTVPRKQAGGDLKTTCRKSLAIFIALCVYTCGILNWMPKDTEA